MYSDHQKALESTGFWGKFAAGCIFLAQDTKRILLSHRSMFVLEPNTWGSWGGAIDSGENPEEAVIREAREETGCTNIVNIVPLYIFKNGTFRYFNFLVIVNQEFEPQLDWENQGYKWCNYGEWPSPLHFGLETLLHDSQSVETINEYMR